MDLHDHPVRQMMYLTLIDVVVTYDPQDAEMWINPADWDDIGRPAGFGGLPVRTSQGIPRGTARIFCRTTLRYLPLARP